MDYGNHPKVQVQNEENKTTYSIFDTKAYTLGGETYMPIRNYDRYEFMRLVSTGYVSLYAFKPQNQNGYDGLFLQKMDGTFMEVPNIGFKKHMGRFLEDCGDISERISSGDLTRKNLEEILREYNSCITNRTKEKQAIIVTKIENKEKADPWQTLDEKIKNTAEFDGKSTALEMVAEVINKVTKNEKVPSFVIDGLKNVLRNQEQLKEPLENALKTIEN